MYSHQKLKTFCKAVFLKIGCPEDHAEGAAEVLTAADLRGVDSHGVARLSAYVRLWDNDRLHTEPNITIIHETPGTASVDGDKGLGLVVAPHAMQLVHLHLACAIPNLMQVELIGIQEDYSRELFKEMPPHEDGMWSPFSDRPGLGIELRPDAMEKYAR